MAGVTKIAILDDYIGVALAYGDWTVLPDDAEITVYRQAIPPERLVDELSEYEIVVITQQRVPAPATGVGKFATLMAQVPDVAVTAVDLLAAGGHGDAALLGIIEAILARTISTGPAGWTLRVALWQLDNMPERPPRPKRMSEARTQSVSGRNKTGSSGRYT